MYCRTRVCEIDMPLLAYSLCALRPLGVDYSARSYKGHRRPRLTAESVLGIQKPAHEESIGTAPARRDRLRQVPGESCDIVARTSTTVAVGLDLSSRRESVRGPRYSVAAAPVLARSRRPWFRSWMSGVRRAGVAV